MISGSTFSEIIFSLGATDHKALSSEFLITNMDPITILIPCKYRKILGDVFVAISKTLKKTLGDRLYGVFLIFPLDFSYDSISANNISLTTSLISFLSQ